MFIDFYYYLILIYAKGMTAREIAAVFKEPYDADVSPTLI